MEEIVREVKDDSRNRIEKYVARWAFILGIVFILLSLGCHVLDLWLEFDLKSEYYRSLLENVGAALLIPPIFLWVKSKIFRKKIFRESRPETEYLINNMKSELWMLGISLRNVHNKPKRERFKSLILKKISDSEKSKTTIKFKFLLADPDSLKDILEKREKVEDGKVEDRIVDECNKTIKILEEIKGSISVLGAKYVKFNYGTYKDPILPTYSLIWVDGVMFVGPYLYCKPGYRAPIGDKQAEESPWLEVTDKKARRAFENDFEELWKIYGPKSTATAES